MLNARSRMRVCLFEGIIVVSSSEFLKPVITAPDRHLV